MKTGLHIFLSVFFLSSFCSAQWIQQNSNTTVTLNSVKFYNAEIGIVVGNNGLILKTTNGGTDWIPKQSGTTRDLLCLEIIGNNICIASGAREIIKSTDSGESWYSIYNGTLTFYGLEFIDSMTGFATGHLANTTLTSILKTTDGGLNWNEVYAQYHFPFNDISFADLSNGLAVGYSGRIIKTTDSGASWTQMVSSVSEPIFCIRYNDINNAIASSLQMILRSPNGGVTWNVNFVGPGMSAIKCMSFVDMLGVYAVGSQGVNGNTLILRSTNGGLNWIEETYYGSGLTSVHFVDLNTGTAVGYNGTILHITNAGLPVELSSFKIEGSTSGARLKWITSSEINNFGFEIERNYLDEEWITRGFVTGAGSITECREYEFMDVLSVDGTYKYRLKQIDLNGNYQYSEVLEFSYFALNYSLEQNYPNPFNPVTTISYTIAERGNVSLVVYDILGNQQSVLENSVKEAGTYKITYNASSLSSGVYFYKLTSGSFSEIKKFTLLK